MEFVSKKFTEQLRYSRLFDPPVSPKPSTTSMQAREKIKARKTPRPKKRPWYRKKKGVDA